ncbi:MAG: alpha/beta hydrolase [Bryobacteraceae bacterium]|nr:alpha/beta hydrolase [Bryobacteraceae bacterium]
MEPRTISMILEAQVQQFLDAAAAEGGPPIYTLAPAEARLVLEKAQSGFNGAFPARIEDRSLPIGPNGQVDVRIVRPTGSHRPLPVILFFHGGGWILGSENTHDRLIRALAVGADAAVVFVKFTRSPEAQYPTALEEAYAATTYLAEHGNELNLNGSQLAVVGDSAGANMATAVAMLAKQRGGPRICCQILFYPVTDARLDTASYREFAEGPWLTQAAMAWFWDAYAPDPATHDEPTVSPNRATVAELTGMPPALVVTAANDVLRDEGEAYALKLIQAGVEVTAVRFQATIHDFVMLNDLAETEAARTAVDLAVSKLAEAFA